VNSFSKRIYDVGVAVGHRWEIGEVTNGKTLNYKTLKPAGGLFCQRIFGPVNDFQCACGKHKTQENQKFVFVASSTSHHEVDAIKWVGLKRLNNAFMVFKRKYKLH
jgi:DNA-directed RNA polymerase beta' subunit